MNHTSPRVVCRLAIGMLIGAFAVSTWLAMGLVVPVTVAGSSMAPTLRGPHRIFRCEVCRHEFPVGLDQLPPDGRAQCLYCGQRRAVPIADRNGQHILVNRCALASQQLRRWQAVVFRCPQSADQLCVKRVVGLPGEMITLISGDVWIDGRPARKTLSQQQAVRQLVHSLASDISIPPGPDAHTIASSLDRWQWDANDRPEGFQWLVYHHPGAGPITDDSSYNQRAPYELHPVSDLMVTFDAQLTGHGQLRLAGGEAMFELDTDGRSIELRRGTDAVVKQSWHLEPSRGGWAHWTFSLFDRQVLLAVDGRVVMAVPWEPGPASGSLAERPLAIGFRGLGGKLRNITVWRDVYYSVRPEDRPEEKGAELFFSQPRQDSLSLAKNSSDPFSTLGWRLGPHDYFVLGDNAAVSDDSRSWLAGPGLDAKLIVGTPLGVR